jgi:hypothetical protein
VLKDALLPRSQEEAYLAVLNTDRHMLVVHSLVRLETKLWPSNPIKGKIAAFKGEVQSGGSTPNLVVFDKDSEIFVLALFPVINLGAVVEYHAGHSKNLPGVDQAIKDNLGEDDDNTVQVRKVMPIPTEWVPLFLDNPTLGTAIARLNALVDELATQAELDFYKPFVLFLDMAACARNSDSNTSMVTITASTLA